MSHSGEMENSDFVLVPRNSGMSGIKADGPEYSIAQSLSRTCSAASMVSEQAHPPAAFSAGTAPSRNALVSHSPSSLHASGSQAEPKDMVDEEELCVIHSLFGAWEEGAGAAAPDSVIAGASDDESWTSVRDQDIEPPLGDTVLETSGELLPSSGTDASGNKVDAPDATWHAIKYDEDTTACAVGMQSGSPKAADTSVLAPVPRSPSPAGSLKTDTQKRVVPVSSGPSGPASPAALQKHTTAAPFRSSSLSSSSSLRHTLLVAPGAAHAPGGVGGPGRRVGGPPPLRQRATSLVVRAVDTLGRVLHVPLATVLRMKRKLMVMVHHMDVPTIRWLLGLGCVVVGGCAVWRLQYDRNCWKERCIRLEKQLAAQVEKTVAASITAEAALARLSEATVWQAHHLTSGFDVPYNQLVSRGLAVTVL